MRYFFLFLLIFPAAVSAQILDGIGPQGLHLTSGLRSLGSSGGSSLVGTSSVKPYWAGKPLALVIEMDGSYASQPEFIAVLDSFNLKCTLATAGTTVIGPPTKMTFDDLRGYQRSGHEIAWRGKWVGRPPGYPAGTSDEGIIRYSTCDSIALDYDWSDFSDSLNVDGWLPKTFVPPNHRYNRELIDLFIADGILGSRTLPISNYNAEVESWDDIATYGCFPAPEDSPEIEPARMTWSGNVNPYAVSLTWMSTLIGGQGSRTKSSVYAAVNNHFDAQLPDSSCTVVYLHRKTADGGELTVDEFSWLIHATIDRGDVDTDTMLKQVSTYRASHVAVPGTEDLVWNLTGTLDPIESWVFSNSSILQGGTYDNTVTAVGGAGELLYGSSALRAADAPLRMVVKSGGWGISESGERAGILDFDVATELSDLEIVKATLGWQSVSFATFSGGANIIVDVVGITHSDLDDWVDFSTSTASDVSYNYYDTSETSAWGTSVNTFTSAAPDDGWTSRYPTTNTVWGVHSDTTIISYVENDSFTVDVTEAVQAWADGSNEGGFLIFGSRAGGATFYIENMNDGDAARRPYLEVYAR